MCLKIKVGMYTKVLQLGIATVLPRNSSVYVVNEYMNEFNSEFSMFSAECNSTYSDLLIASVPAWMYSLFLSIYKYSHIPVSVYLFV